MNYHVVHFNPIRTINGIYYFQKCNLIRCLICVGLAAICCYTHIGLDYGWQFLASAFAAGQTKFFVYMFCNLDWRYEAISSLWFLGVCCFYYFHLPYEKGITPDGAKKMLI